MFPDQWIGLNFFGLAPLPSLGLVPPTASGLWVGDAGVIEDAGEQPTAAEFSALRADRGWNGLYFGGVAFKHQRPVKDVAAAAAAAKPFVDVVTTSGPGTGQPPQVDKIAAMRQALGSHPLAIASGISPANIGSYARDADYFLVATSVSQSESELDPDRLADLFRAFRN